MTSTGRYVPGDYKAVCDVCGFVFRASQMRRRWDGRMVCQQDWEPRHPQEQRNTRTSTATPPWSRAEPTVSYVDYTDGFDGSTL